MDIYPHWNKDSDRVIMKADIISWDHVAGKIVMLDAKAAWDPTQIP